MGEIGEVAPEVAELTMREESFADVVNILERSVFNVKDTVHNKLVEHDFVYLSPRFDSLPHCGSSVDEGSGARGVAGCVFMRRVGRYLCRCCVLYH